MKRIIIAVVLAIAALLAATGIGLGIIQISGFPYVADMDYLNISETSGIPQEEILANYNAVIAYHVPFSNSEFHLPTLKYSEEGAAHFADTKAAFTLVYTMAFISCAIIFALFAFRAADGKTLKYSGILTLAIPLVFALALAIDFDGMFVLFHKLFFAGDTWIFDPRVDEIIKILPGEFFMHCALFIALFWILAAAGFFAAAARKRKVDKEAA